MSDEYYDSKGIRHRSQRDAERANEDYNFVGEDLPEAVLEEGLSQCVHYLDRLDTDSCPTPENLPRAHFSLSRETGKIVDTPPQPTRITFDLALERVPPWCSAAVVQALANLKPGLSLAEAAKLAKTAPRMFLEGLSELEVKAAKEQLESAGAGVRIDRNTVY